MQFIDHTLDEHEIAGVRSRALILVWGRFTTSSSVAVVRSHSVRFIRGGTPSVRDVPDRHHSMLAALERGLTLPSCGTLNVWFSGIRGLERSPAEFSRAVFWGRGPGHGRVENKPDGPRRRRTSGLTGPV